MTKIMKWGAVAIAGLLMIQSASALGIVRERNSSEYYVTGTEFYDSDYAAGATYMGGFNTFCIEKSEILYLGSEYAYTTEPYAIAGGSGQVVIAPGLKGDWLSVGTGWLYSQFATGQLGPSGFNYNGGRATSAYYLQEAFWWLENEITSLSSLNPFRDDLIGQFGSLESARASATPGQYNVYALNLTRPSDGALRQSLLVYDVRTGPTPVTDGGLTVMMLGAGVMACSFLRRKIAR